ncbi:MAG: hypothetical protein HY689_09900 [Chloroflexi bacterium]|nr:hypothetical protein [Chloroflexota bacterium]
MTAETLLRELQSRGFVLTPEPPDGLRVNAPRGALTPELRATLAAHKPESIALLSRAEAQPTTEGVAPMPSPKTPTPQQVAESAARWLTLPRLLRDLLAIWPGP